MAGSPVVGGSVAMGVRYTVPQPRDSPHETRSLRDGRRLPQRRQTTTLARLARQYMARGERVGLVTNDQAQDLVDTTSLRAQGFAVQEVPGACFCCKFDELVSRAGTLQEAERPDVILAEPVGSCTDLVATVVQPLKDLYSGRFQVAPYSVLFKPSHGLRILRNEQSGFSPKAAYIFRKQLEEADAIVINRADELAAGEVEDLKGLLAEQFRGTPVLVVSARTGLGFDAYANLLTNRCVWPQTTRYRLRHLRGRRSRAGMADTSPPEFDEAFEIDPLLVSERWLRRCFFGTQRGGT